MHIARRPATRPNKPCAGSSQTGVNLVELVITIAIVGILASIAYPSYQDHIRKSRRTEAKSQLFRIQADQQGYFSENNTFAPDMTTLGYTNQNELTENDWYLISVDNPGWCPPQTCFFLTATPQTDQANDRCGTFQLDAFGNKTVNEANATAEECW